jgi:hypothetical protein
MRKELTIFIESNEPEEFISVTKNNKEDLIIVRLANLPPYAMKTGDLIKAIKELNDFYDDEPELPMVPN